VGAEATGGGHGSDSIRGVYMSAGVLSGFTITNGHTVASGTANYDTRGGGVNMYGGSGVVSNCVIVGNASGDSGGGTHYGSLYDCTLTGNSAFDFGGGSYEGTLNRCVLIRNVAGTGGGGNSAGTLNNCVLIGNTADSVGGGSSSAVLNDCTLVGNSAGTWAGGSYLGALTNCIVYFNSAGTSNNVYGSSLSYSCTTPDPGGSGNITNDPQFVDAGSGYGTNHVAGNYRLTAWSPCVDAGQNATWMSTATDLDGTNRIIGGTVDMGAYERDSLLDYTNIVWTTKEPMPTPRSSQACATLHNRAFVVGGWSLSNNTAALEVYDPVRDAWEVRAPMPSEERALAACAFDGKLYVFGSVGSPSAVLEYDPVTDSWDTDKTAMPTARYNSAPVALGGKIYVLGGEAPNNARVSTVEAYDPTLDSWESKTSMNTGRDNLAGVAVDGKIYAIGGGDASGGSYGTLEVYDPVSNSWSYLPSMSLAREEIYAAVVEGKIYVAGGEPNPGSSVTDVVEVYDPSIEQWYSASDLHTPRHSVGLFALNNQLCAVGGWMEGVSDVDTNKVGTIAASTPGRKESGRPWCCGHQRDDHDRTGPQSSS